MIYAEYIERRQDGADEKIEKREREMIKLVWRISFTAQCNIVQYSAKFIHQNLRIILDD